MENLKDDKKNTIKKNRCKVKKKKKTKKKFIKTLIAFIVFEIIFTAVTAPFVLLYGPFNNAKRVWVGSAMTTMSHKYLATAFLSDKKIEEILNSGNSGDGTVAANATSADVNLKNRNDNIELFQFENSKYQGYMLVINDPSRVKVASTKYLGKKGETTSQMAQDHNAVAAINGGSFVDKSSSSNWTGNGGTPTGILMTEGKVIPTGTGPNEKKETMAITKEGKMLAGKYSINELKALGVQEAVSFGPTLIRDGAQVQLNGEDSSQGVAPRTAIGQRSDGSIVMMVIDGRSIVDGLGCSITELQQLMLTEGKCVTAINLDGGKSSTMYLNGEVVNDVSNGLGERYIASSVIVE
ncbi:MAG: phosphodiester glycosidase family protein [Clostridium sp.]